MQFRPLHSGEMVLRWITRLSGRGRRKKLHKCHKCSKCRKYFADPYHSQFDNALFNWYFNVGNLKNFEQVLENFLRSFSEISKQRFRNFIKIFKFFVKNFTEILRNFSENFSTSLPLKLIFQSLLTQRRTFAHPITDRATPAAAFQKDGFVTFGTTVRTVRTN